MAEDEIAIIGMAGRFPESETLEEFWNHLMEGKDLISRNQKIIEKNGYARVGAYGKVKDQYGFDAEFFKMNEKEAIETDPQERMLLQLVYEALENAAVVVQGENRIGIICGAKENEYALKRYYQSGLEQIEKETAKVYLGASLVTKIAYKLNLQGPSIQVKESCATALAAVHEACKMLLDGQTDIMVAGGINLSLENEYYTHMEGGITSKDGVVRAFSKEANGCVPGDGAGVFVLKRLADAIQDKDQIIAVIKGSAFQNDGSQKMGFSAPSREAEKRTILEALKVSHVMPKELCYVESHGTATRLGDMVEIAALKEVFKENPHLVIGAIKNNIGHLNYAAGAAGLAKTALILHNKQIPPVINVDEVNEAMTGGNLVLNKEPIVLETEEKTVYAGVSSFGIGGNNVHMILRNFPKTEKEKKYGRYLLLFSAKTKESLEAYEHKMENYLQNTKDTLEDIQYTLAYGRNHYPFRSYWIVAEQETGRTVEETGHCVEEGYNGGKEFCLENSTLEQLQMAGKAYIHGSNIVWNRESSENVCKVSLPSYCFQKKEYNLFAEEVQEEEKNMETKQSVNVESGVLKILNEVVGSRVTPENQLEEFGIDSLAFVLVSSKIQSAFQVELSVMDLYEFDTVQDMIEEIHRLRREEGFEVEQEQEEDIEKDNNIEDLFALFE